METVEALQWLKKNKLYDVSTKIYTPLKKVYSTCLGITNEKILIIGDMGYGNCRVAPTLACAYYLAAKKLNFNIKLILQKFKITGEEADRDVIESISNLDKGSVIIITASNHLGSLDYLGKSFRNLCKKNNYRFISALSLGGLSTSEITKIIEAIDINYKILQIKQRKVKELLDQAKELHITTNSGTDLYIGIKGMKAISADGDYTKPGIGGNLPAGEVYIPPCGKEIEGKIVIDGSSKNRVATVIVKKPINITIEKGSIVEISGGKEAKMLEETLEWVSSKVKHPALVRRIGEFGIGFNPKARIIGSTLVDEKVLGTAHIGIGSNYWFGGNIYTIIHLDQVFKEPKIFVDNELLKI